MRQRLVALGVGLLFLSAVVGVAVVSRQGDDDLRKLPFGAAGAERTTAAADSGMLARSVRYELVDGVDDPGDEAAAYEMGAAGRTQAEEVAAALGLGGEAKADGEAWVVEDDGRTLRLEPSGAWYLGDAGCGKDAVLFEDSGDVSCVSPPVQSVAGVAEPSAGGGSAGSAGSTGTASATPTQTAEAPVADAPPRDAAPPDAPTPPPTYACDMPECPEGAACIQSCPEPVPVPRPERPADLPDEDEATAIARRALSRMGLDPDEGRLQVSDDFSSWGATFDPEVGGALVLGASQHLAIGSKGVVVAASGWVLDPEEIGRYPLAGLDEGVARLNDPTKLGGAGVGRDGVPAIGAPEPDIATCEEGDAACQPPTGDEPLVPEEAVVRLVDVELALQLVASYRAGDPTHLVPAYLFEIEGGGEIPVVAVTDELLAETAPPEPEPDPGGGVEPGGSGGSAGSCSGSAEAESTSGNAALIVSVCASGTEVAVGETVVFDVTAYDEDAPIDLGDCRFAPEALFGDEEGAVPGGCIADCEAPRAGQTWTKEPGKHGATFRHAYERPGTYTATFSAQSGDACRQNPYGSQGQATVTITVR